MAAFQAHVQEEWPHRLVRLHVAGPWGGGLTARPGAQMVLLQDGNWQEVPAVAAAERSGILVPQDGALALLEALNRWQGNALPSAQEVRRLEEALALERSRVDDALHAGLNRLDPSR